MKDLATIIMPNKDNLNYLEYFKIFGTLYYYKKKRKSLFYNAIKKVFKNRPYLSTLLKRSKIVYDRSRITSGLVMSISKHRHEHEDTGHSEFCLIKKMRLHILIN